ncbi:GNAT family N-acetyltransferase [Amycolatopsis anabasis]|uniref:GNAT family N-acetyltransferase n=1 Tax=Amycolatopsis anabasis TaxID=1840409 RepID=UPI00131B346D|nr:GNAT family protein [Amycolatopsis anabasis]
MTLAERTVLASDAHVAIAGLLDGEREAIDALGDATFDLDPDDRPVPVEVPRFWAAIVDTTTGALLGRVSWRPVTHGPTLSSMAWNIGIKLLPAARRRGLSSAAGLLLARYLFDTTGLDRVQATVDAGNLPGWRGLETAGFHREGVLRGVVRRGGQRRDVVYYSLLRSDLDRPARERAVLGRRDGTVLAEALPGDRVAPDSFAPDPDRDLSPSALPPARRGAVLDPDTGRVLGLVTWQVVDHGGTLGCSAWRLGATPGVDATALRLLVGHLFATTGLDRVEAGVDVDDLARQHAVEAAGFRREGVLRGARLRGGQRRDVVLFGILRTDLAES